MATVSTNGTPLTPRGQRTRASLVAAARQVFEEDGFVEARITDISQRAGVAHGTFYTYFSSKEEAFRSVIQALQAELLEAEAADPQPRGERTVWSTALASNRHYLSVWRRHTSIMRLWEEVASLDPEIADLLDQSRQRFVRRVQAAITRMQDAGHVGPEIDPRYAAYALTGMVSRFAYVWFTQDEDFDFDKVVEQLTALWINALNVEPDTLVD